jgi:transposase
MGKKSDKPTPIKLEELKNLQSQVKTRQLSEAQWLIVDLVFILFIKIIEIVQKNKPSIKMIKKYLIVDEVEQTDDKTEIVNESERVEEKEAKPRKKVKGHGRHKAEDYKKAKEVKCKHEELKEGSKCPDEYCKGQLQKYKREAKFTQFEGQQLVGATNYKQEVLRCGDCQRTFTAPLPEGVKSIKYTATADAAIALAKYGSGMPWNRLSQLQKSFGIPISASVMWERCEEVANALLAIFIQLRIMAALCSVLYYDDTSVKIIDCQPSLAEKRKGIRTSGLVADLGAEKIAIYVSGRKHAGDNAKELLEKRPASMQKVIRMSDALSANLSNTGQDTISLCLAHGSRKFVEIKASNLEYCTYVLEEISKVYENDKNTKKMTSQERLEYHQANSGPIMKKLKEWIEERFEKKQVEPNSALGRAFNYLTGNWDGLTCFLKEGKAPLDNNVCERALKLVVLHRKNALYYRNDTGAAVADCIMSIIETCKLNQVSAYDYIVTVIENYSRVRKNPSRWLPWNYLEQIEEINKAA